MTVKQITLSRRQAKEADRVGGIELMILWPPELGPEPDGWKVDEEREATPRERAAAERLVVASCEAHSLVPVHVRVACVERPPDRQPGARVHLAVTIIGRRWVHASTRRSGRVMFA